MYDYRVEDFVTLSWHVFEAAYTDGTRAEL